MFDHFEMLLGILDAECVEYLSITLISRIDINNVYTVFTSTPGYRCRAVARGGIGGVANPPNFCRINIFGKLGWPFGKLRQ
jgi:hypothetical protein